MAAYTVGIDLGTTHTVVAFAPAKGRVTATTIRLFEIEQLVDAGEVAPRPLLPSLRYQLAAGEIAVGDLALPWGQGPDGAVIGSLARQLGAQVPGRLVASAKSWLSHAAAMPGPIPPLGCAGRGTESLPVATSEPCTRVPA
jgi:molecular chaperone DnaK (HSP70)